MFGEFITDSDVLFLATYIFESGPICNDPMNGPALDITVLLACIWARVPAHKFHCRSNPWLHPPYKTLPFGENSQPYIPASVDIVWALVTNPVVGLKSYISILLIPPARP